MSTRQILILVVMFGLVLFATIANAQITFDETSQKQMAMTNMSAMPMAFTENLGQWGEKTLFRAEASGATFYFCKDEVAYLFVRDTDELLEDDHFPGQDMPGLDDRFSRPRYKKESLLIKAQFVGTNPHAEVIGEDRLSHNCNYFYGNDPDKWCTDVPNYSTIIYKDIYSGIDLKYYGNGKSMKYDFIVHPGADLSQITIRYTDVEDISISHNGDLQMATRFGLVYENKPYVYQNVNGRVSEVKASYYLKEPGVFGFRVDGYNPAYMLIIDPELIYSTYLGGNDAEGARGIAIDGSGNVYVTGLTSSNDFPTYPDSAYDSTYYSGGDAFVTKLSPEGNSLIYSTYLGGNDSDIGNDITVDISGNAYVIGWTSSTNFPTENPYQTNQAALDAFVTKLSSNGNSLIYSTYLGGTGDDFGNGIAIDDSGNAYITGETSSSNFPTLNPFQTNLQGNEDAFVTKLSTEGNSIIYSTYLGGESYDRGYGIAVDSSGCSYITGRAGSAYFPTLNPYQLSQGATDAFVTKLSSSGASLIYSTYLGGSGNEWSIDIAVDGSGCAYIAGHTMSSDFPTENAYDSTYYSSESFVTKFNPAGDSLIFSTYLGGSGADYIYSIAINSSGNTYVTGKTNSPDFPTENPYQLYQGGWDAFVTRFSAEGNDLIYSTYLGGNDSEEGQDIAVNGGIAYVTGHTFSTNFPTLNPYQVNQGSMDVFLTKFETALVLFPFHLISPITDTIFYNTPEEFIWESTEVSDSGIAASYKFYLDDNSMFSSPDSSGILSDTVFVLSDTLARSTQYYWRIMAFSDYTPPIFSDETWNFYIDGYPTLPEIFAPENGTLANSSTFFSWLIATDPDTFDAVSYTIQMDDDSLFTTPEINQSGLTSGTILDDAFAIMLGDLEGIENLSIDTRYYWRVRADDNYGLSSDWPDSLNYFIYLHQNHPPIAPDTGFSPANYEEVISLTPTIAWNNATDPDPDDHPGTLHYIFHLISDTSTGCGFEYRDTTEAGINQVTVADTMPDNCLWIYFVKTVDDEGLESGWSSMQHFWTNHYNYPPEPFPLVTPLADIKRVDYYTYFNWGSTVDYDPISSFDFTLQYSPDSMFNYYVYTIDELTDTNLTMVTDTIALAGQNLYWRILAIDDDNLVRIGGIPEEVRKLTIIPAGDANTDLLVLGSDVIYLVGYFKGNIPAPDPLLAGDANGDCQLIGSDITRLVSYFKGFNTLVRGDCEGSVILMKGRR